MRIRIISAIAVLTSMLFATAAFAATPIKIGALFAVTGPAAFLGEPERNSAKMVVDEINAAGGVKGHKLELIVYDTAGDATKAVQLEDTASSSRATIFESPSPPLGVAADAPPVAPVSGGVVALAAAL